MNNSGLITSLRIGQVLCYFALSSSCNLLTSISRTVSCEQIALNGVTVMNLIASPFILGKAKMQICAIIEIRVGSTVCSILFESRTLLMFQLLAECAAYTLGLYPKFLYVSKANAETLLYKCW